MSQNLQRDIPLLACKQEDQLKFDGLNPETWRELLNYLRVRQIILSLVIKASGGFPNTSFRVSDSKINYCLQRFQLPIVTNLLNVQKTSLPHWEWAIHAFQFKWRFLWMHDIFGRNQRWIQVVPPPSKGMVCGRMNDSQPGIFQITQVTSLTHEIRVSTFWTSACMFLKRSMSGFVVLKDEVHTYENYTKSSNKLLRKKEADSAERRA